MAIIKSNWPVKTFRSKSEDNYNKAINYYRQKKAAFFGIAIQQQAKLGQKAGQTIGLSKLIKQNMAAFNKGVADSWSHLYNQKMNQAEIASKLATWNSLTQSMNKQVMNAMELITFVNQLMSTNHALPIDDINLSNISSISMSYINSLIAASVNGAMNSMEFGGLRGQVFGEIFENLVADSFQSGLGDVIKVLRIGIANTTRSATGGGSVQGKTDIMLSAKTDITLDKDLQGLTVGKMNTGKTISLDALEWLDLETDGINKFNQYFQKDASRLFGISAKQWTSNIIKHKTGLSSKASFGSSTLTAAMIEQRWSPYGPKTISWVFDNSQNFTAYTGYIVSRYLINIIGVYNGIMALGDKMWFTDDWLEELKAKSWVIAHAFNWGAIQSNKTGRIAEKAYNVRKSLVVAYQGKDK